MQSAVTFCFGFAGRGDGSAQNRSANRSTLHRSLLRSQSMHLKFTTVPQSERVKDQSRHSSSVTHVTADVEEKRKFYSEKQTMKENKQRLFCILHYFEEEEESNHQK